MTIARRNLLAIAAAAAAAPLAAPARADTFPSRPVRFVVPFAAGGPTDVIARVLAEQLREPLGQPVVVENRPGAGGNIAIRAVAGAAPDGYTLLFSSSNIVSNPWLAERPPFDPVRDFAPISYAAVSPNIIFVHPSVPARDVAELAALLRSQPGRFSYGHPGVGTTPHIAVEAFRLAIPAEVVHVPYQGAAPVVTAVLGNQVPIGTSALPPTATHVAAGTLRAIAVTSERRSALMPNVPTLAESGFPTVIADNLQGILAPAGTPAAIIERLNRAVVAVLTNPDIRQRLTGLGFDVHATSPAEFQRIISVETERYQRMIRAAGIRAE